MLSVPAVADEEDSDRDLQVEKIFKPRTQWLGRCRGRVHVLKQGTVRSLDVLSSHGALFLPLSGQHHCRRVLSGKPSTGLGSSKKNLAPALLLEEEESIYMQFPSHWQLLLQELLKALENRRKPGNQCVSLLDWASIRQWASLSDTPKAQSQSSWPSW